MESGTVVRGRFARGRPPEAVILNPREGTAVLVLLGEHDFANETKLNAQLATLVAEYPLVVVDLSHVEFFDSFCLNTVLSAHKRSVANGHRLVLQLGDNAGTRRLLELTGLLSHLNCVNSRVEALARPPRLEIVTAGAETP